MAIFELDGGISHWLPLNNRWHHFKEKGGRLYAYRGAEIVEVARGSEEDDVRQILEQYERNRMSFFLPHGGGKDFINDWTNGIVLLVACSRSGKSCHNTIFSALRTIKCDPNWHCFQEHGLEYHEFRGPRKLVISSYSWSNVEEVWEEYRKWLPRTELGPYSPDWGKFEGEKGKERQTARHHHQTPRCEPIHAISNVDSVACSRDIYNCDEYECPTC